MMPFMYQNVVLFIESGETDKYGKPKTTEQYSKARVQFKSTTHLDKEQSFKESNIEVDLPPNTSPAEGMAIKGETPDGKTFEGKIDSVEDIVNLFGSKVHYRTVFVSGKF